jgi:siroheme decarboxylase
MSQTTSAEPNLSQLERDILNIIQQGFPVHHAPYAEMARIIGGVDEKQVYDTVIDLMERKIIRRLGAIFDTRKLGFMSTLMAMRVPAERIDEVGAIVSDYAGVSHNYKRDYEYNLWFTLAAPSRRELTDTIEEIKQRTGVEDVLYLPTVHLHKIFVNFDMTKKAPAAEGAN